MFYKSYLGPKTEDLKVNLRSCLGLVPMLTISLRRLSLAKDIKRHWNYIYVFLLLSNLQSWVPVRHMSDLGCHSNCVQI